MDEDDWCNFELKTIGTRRNGSRDFDPAGKERLIVECLKPGVSVAALAVASGVNPNLLRRWVDARRKKLGYKREQAASPPSPSRPSPFIQIVTSTGPPNAVEMEASAIAAIETSIGDIAAQQAVDDYAVSAHHESHRTRGPGDHHRPDPLKGLFSEEVAPLLEARPELLTFTVLEAILERHPDLGPKIYRTLEHSSCGERAKGGEDGVIRQTQEPDRFLRTREASQFLGLSSRTLEKHRTYGTGPVYRKLGGRVVYRLADLQRWADLGIVSSTDQSGMVRAAMPQYRTNSPRGVRGGNDHARQNDNSSNEALSDVPSDR